MLYRFEIENFYSIRDRQVIDLAALKNAPSDCDALAPIWRGANDRASKVMALFGPNASGKSNVLRAISFVIWFVRNSFGLPPNSIPPYSCFNGVESLVTPTKFVLHFGGPADLARTNDPEGPVTSYAYELEIGVDGSNGTGIYESLSYKPLDSRKRVTLIERHFGEVRAAKSFGLAGFKKTLDAILRPEVSVISTLAQLQHPLATLMWNATSLVRSNILFGRVEFSDKAIFEHYSSHPELIEAANRELCRVDLGLVGMEIQQTANGPVAMFHHEGLHKPMLWSQQSRGTQQFLALFPMIMDTLSSGGLAVLDELDSAIHPVMMGEVLRWFRDPLRNPRDAQLWMSCHNITLLENLDKEEVFFTEKNRQGSTSVFALKDIRSVRRIDNYTKKYLSGVYGALPVIG
jgi:ABC-type polar amino acid transport system ATPase subunit